jgi:hypothetical protein
MRKKLLSRALSALALAGTMLGGPVRAQTAPEPIPPNPQGPTSS